MNSQQAAKRLKVSVRSLQRLAHKHQLTVTYQRGKSGKQEAHYDPEQINRLKDELAAPTVTVKEQTQLATIPDASRQSAIVAASDRERLTAALEAIAATMGKPAIEEKKTDAPSLSDLAAKPLLTIAEAQRLTGLSRQTLLDAHQAGKLKLIVIGRGYKVKAKDLTAFVDKL